VASHEAPAVDHPGVVILPPVLYLIGLALGFLIHWAAPRPIVSSSFRFLLGGVLVVLAMVLARWGQSVMDRAGTNVKPTKPTTALVVTGPFRYSRNPLYISLTLLYLGIALLANSLWVMVMIVPVLAVLHYGVVLREERYLEARFGDTYRAYRARVRRYL
jgi:protein-S-isoprenylcysteine O-methyltransferase Ste14